MLLAFHITLAYLTVAGFVIRGGWKLTGSGLAQENWVRIAPHVIDTALLSLGVALAVRMSLSPFSGWLAAKLVGLLCYIGFGMLAMRASRKPWQVAGFVGALVSVSYVFAVAFSRSAWPL